MLLAVTASLAFGFTVISALLKKGYLAFAGAGSWIIASIYCFTLHATTWDTYFSLGFLFIFLMLVCVFSPLAYRETTAQGDRTEDPDVAEMRADMSEFNKYRNQYSFLNKRRR